MQNTQQIHQLLASLELELKKNNMWSDNQLDLSLLTSTEPFCHDTISLEQWLQFVFVIKIKHILQNNLPLPSACNITSYAQEVYKEKQNTAGILAVLNDIDNYFNK